MECKNCGTTNQDNAKFCSGCGADLSLQNAG
ncbi:MAG: zinc-ribbon domain-containing protein [Firmicutes bacterium]|nr:zinc-ribbon domain-containing protein [Bacillota bacterium]